MKHFDTEEVELVLVGYKSDPSEANLDLLYNSIDHIITKVTSKIASGFSKKNPDDFMDIQQNVRIAIYRILPKLATISVSGNQIIAIIVKASIWSFKSKYAQYKRNTPVKGVPGEWWLPDNEVPVEIQLEAALGGFNSVEVDATDEGRKNNTYNPHALRTYLAPKTWINSSQYETLYLKTLPAELLNKALDKNRYKKEVDLVRFCLLSLIENRDASPILINKKWNTKATFWNNYSEVLMRLAILDMVI